MTTPTSTIIYAMRILARDIQSDDGVANAAIAEAAERLEEQQKHILQLTLERDAARVPLCIGKPIIEILASDGQWLSENGRGVIAADCLFRKSPYSEIDEMKERIKQLESAGTSAIHEAEFGRASDAWDIWNKAKSHQKTT